MRSEVICSSICIILQTKQTGARQVPVPWFPLNFLTEGWNFLAPSATERKWGEMDEQRRKRSRVERERERNNRPPLLSLIHFTSQLASCWHEVLVLSAHFKLRGFGQVTSYLSFSSLLYRTGLVRAINLRGCWKLEWDHGNVIRPLRMGVMKPKGPFLHPTRENPFISTCGHRFVSPHSKGVRSFLLGDWPSPI